MTVKLNQTAGRQAGRKEMAIHSKSDRDRDRETGRAGWQWPGIDCMWEPKKTTVRRPSKTTATMTTHVRQREGEREGKRERERELDRGFILKHNRKTVSAANFRGPLAHTHTRILRLANEYNQCQSIFCIALEQRVQVSKANPE